MQAAIVAKVDAPHGERRPLLGRLVQPLLERIEVEGGWVDRVREVAARGTVVHVLLGVGLLEFLCLDLLLRRNGLPPIRMISGAGRLALWPLRWILAALWRRCRPCDSGCVTDVARQGQSSLLFLGSAPRSRGGDAEGGDATEALVALQRQSPGRPIFLLPHMVLWARRRPSARHGFWSLLDQVREGPGLVRLLARTYRARRDAQIRACEPVSLAEFAAAEPEDDIAAREARFAVRRRIEQERRVILGPAAKSPEAVREEVLRGTGLADEIDAIARAQGVPSERLRRRAGKLLREIQAEPSTSYIAGLNAFLWWAWSKLFEGVEVDEEGFERLREAAHEGPVVLVSSHKSHVDYLILSQIFWEKGIFPPHIVAGKNLSFWPIGVIFRRCGAFFIRRRFSGDALYVAVLSAYVRKILQDGYNMEFFIEGTRSRSGKMLPPKFGMLSMIWDAAQRLKGHTVHLIPVSVTYGRVPEEGSHAAESGGGEKRAENLGGLLATRRLLRRGHGRIYVQFGEPILVEREVSLDDEGEEVLPTEEERRRTIRSLAYRAAYEVNRVTLVTPTSLVAMALLLNRRRGMTHEALRRTARRLAARAAGLGARFSASLQHVAAGRPMDGALVVAAASFLKGAGLVAFLGEGESAIFTVAPERRLRLDYYKAMVLHPFVHEAVVAASLGPRAGEGRTHGEVGERVRFLSRLLKHEFTFRADADLEVNLEQTVAAMVEAREVEVVDGQVRARGLEGARAVRGLSAMLESFLESYRVVVRVLRDLGGEAATDRDLVKSALALGERMYLVGEIELREALSKVNFGNALSALVDLEVLDKGEDQRLSVREAYREAAALERLERRIASYLER